MRDAEGNPIEGRTRAITSGKLKVTPERIAKAPDMLHFEKGIYCAFIKSGVLQGDHGSGCYEILSPKHGIGRGTEEGGSCIRAEGDSA